MDGSGRAHSRENEVLCQECRRTPADEWTRWRGYRTDEPGEEPALAFYCPDCAEREFGPLGATRGSA